MLRVTRFSSRRPLTPQEAFKAIEAAQGVAAAANQVQGVKNCRLYLSAGDLVLAAELDGYAAADKTLGNSGIQASVAILAQEFNYVVSGDEFFLEPEQVYPFLRR